MKKKTRGIIKVFSVILAFSLIFGSLGISMTVFAENGDHVTVSAVTEEQNEEEDIAEAGAEILAINETNYRAVFIALIIGCAGVIAEIILIRREVEKRNVRRGRRRRRR